MDNFLAFLIVTLTVIGIVGQWYNAGQKKTPVFVVLISNTVSGIILYLIVKAYLI